MALSAFDCIHRGLLNLRANWELVLIQWLQVLLATLLVLAGLLPPLAVVGWASPDLLEMVAGVGRAVGSWSELVGRGRQAWPLLFASLVVAAAIWLIAMLVFCYFQGGILGVLMAGDRQAAAGRPRHWKWFRTFTTRDLRGWAGRYLWRYFWLFHLFLLLATVWLLLPLALAMAVTWVGSQWGTPAGVGLGCGGAIPLVFSLAAAVFWLNLAQADLAREASSVRRAAGRALQVLGRRLGAVVVIFLVGFLASLSVSIASSLLSLVATPLAGDSIAASWFGQIAASLLQWIASSVIGVALIATLVGLVRSESLQESSP